MADLTPEIVDEIAAVCRSCATEAGEAFGRAFGTEITVSVGAPGIVDPGALPEELSGGGLIVVLTVGSTGALLVLAESTGMVPKWCVDPDPTGQSKLTTLAQELGMILLPERFMPDDFKTARAENLAGAIRRGGVVDGASIVPLELSSEGSQGTASLIWPVPNPTSVIGSAEPKQANKAIEPTAKPKAAAKPIAEADPSTKSERQKAHLQDLPDYAKSLLKVKVPVVVTLAEKRQPLGRIVELGPGTIIQFEKSCDEMLDMDVADCRVATGEAVKVGDKFGLRITSVVLPEERFKAVTPRSKST